jgi:hypothetical protein
MACAFVCLFYSRRFSFFYITCLVTAIANYTTRVVQTSLSAEQRQEALKFLGLLTSPILSVVIDDFLVL